MKNNYMKENEKNYDEKQENGKKIDKLKAHFFMLATILLIVISITSFIKNNIALIFFGSIMATIELYLVILFVKLVKAVRIKKNED